MFPKKTHLLYINLVPIFVFHPPSLHSFTTNQSRTHQDSSPTRCASDNKSKHKPSKPNMQKCTLQLKEKCLSTQQKLKFPSRAYQKFSCGSTVCNGQGGSTRYTSFLYLSSRTKDHHNHLKQNMGKSPWSRDKNPIARNAHSALTADSEKGIFRNVAVPRIADACRC